VEDTRTAISDSRSIRTTALAKRVTYYTTIAGAQAACTGMKALESLEPYRLQELHAKLH
jgi:carbamoyl-phosphate synthase large subunit